MIDEKAFHALYNPSDNFAKISLRQLKSLSEICEGASVLIKRGDNFEAIDELVPEKVVDNSHLDVVKGTLRRGHYDARTQRVIYEEEGCSFGIVSWKIYAADVAKGNVYQVLSK